MPLIQATGRPNPHLSLVWLRLCRPHSHLSILHLINIDCIIQACAMPRGITVALKRKWRRKRRFCILCQTIYSILIIIRYYPADAAELTHHSHLAWSSCSCRFSHSIPTIWHKSLSTSCIQASWLGTKLHVIYRGIPERNRREASPLAPTPWHADH
jgi:hypothetical protein